MDTNGGVKLNNCTEPLTPDERERLKVTDNTPVDASGDVPGGWFRPSEALTRFVPVDSLEDRGIRSADPLRFGIRVGDIGLLIPVGMHSELVEDAKIYPLPTAPRWFLGLINLRGTLVPIFDLKTLFQMESPDTEQSKLLVFNGGEQAVGFFIDGLPETLHTTQRIAQFPLLPVVLREHAQVEYVQNGRIWVEFDFDGFFGVASRLTTS